MCTYNKNCIQDNNNKLSANMFAARWRAKSTKDQQNRQRNQNKNVLICFVKICQLKCHTKREWICGVHLIFVVIVVISHLMLLFLLILTVQIIEPILCHSFDHPSHLNVIHSITSKRKNLYSYLFDNKVLWLIGLLRQKKTH